MLAFLGFLYGLPLLISGLNALFIRRPLSGEADPQFAILIPARNEATNLAELLPLLKGIRTYVFDDESEDETEAVATRNAAIVLRSPGPLKDGWTGKNRACHQLALAAAEDSPFEWILFLDADVRPEPGFAQAINGMIKAERSSVITGFLNMSSGKVFESLYLSWVPWILLATNPFALVRLTGIGHNGFTNGQFTLWRSSTYLDLLPHQTVKGAILEDVKIGRLLAKRRIRVSVMGLRSVARVKMYDNVRAALDGMSKNSYEITGSAVGSVVVSLLLITWALAWLLAPTKQLKLLFLAFLAGTMLNCKIVSGIGSVLLAPIPLLGGAITFLRSLWWRKSGRVEWKGRNYPG